MLGVMRKLVTVTVLAVVLAGTLAAAVPAATFAATCPDGTDCAAVAGSGNCSGNANGGQNLQNCDLISKYINPLINFFSALVGVIIVIALIAAGIQYSMSAGDPSKASAAKAHIRNAIIALVAFFLLYALINFLVPGGVV